eukprot:15472168-Alexandrium_andersonii.AAC.1
MKEITLGIRDVICDTPLAQQAGAVVAAARRASAIPAVFRWRQMTPDAVAVLQAHNHDWLQGRRHFG